MMKKNTILKIIILTVFLSAISGENMKSIETSQLNQNFDSNLTQANHIPINISGNNDLLSQAIVEGWFGTGTDNDPLIIQNYQIDAKNSNYGIAFHNITLKVLLKNVIMSFPLISGVLIEDSSNITIINNKIDNAASDGIYINRSAYITVRANEITHTQGIDTDEGLDNDFPFAIDVSYSEHILVDKNIIRDGKNGIWFWREVYQSTISNNIIENSTVNAGNSGIIGLGMRSYNNTLNNNLLKNSNGGGISIIQDLGDSFITNNTLLNTKGTGIVSVASKLLYISHNNIINSSNKGLFLSGLTESRIEFNVVINSSDYALQITFGGNIIKNNDFINNSLIENQIKQAYDSSNSKINNTFDSNYWNDWIIPDSDNDSIVDIPYILDSLITREVKDLHPRVNPNKYIVEIEKTEIPSTTSQVPASRWDILSIGLFFLVYSIIKRRN